MNDGALPPLPEPGMQDLDPYAAYVSHDPRSDVLYWFTDEQMRTYGRACADAAIERCAQVCEAERIKRPLDARGDAYNKALEDAAASILALKGQPT